MEVHLRKIHIREALLLLLIGSVLLNVFLVSRLQNFDANGSAATGFTGGENKSIFDKKENNYARNLGLPHSLKQKAESKKAIPDNNNSDRQKAKREEAVTTLEKNNASKPRVPQKGELKKKKTKSVENNIKNDRMNRLEQPPQQLHCAAYGGPSLDKDISEMVYWRTDLPADQQFQSVYKDEQKYFVFEPDEAGFSNVRMSFETVVTMSRAMGRTLVMSPIMRFSQLLHQHPEGLRSYSFTDFFNISNVPIISMEEYLQRVALTGRLHDQNTGEVAFPPYKRTNWDRLLGNSNNCNSGEAEVFYGWLSQAMPAIDWKRDQCIIPFPSKSSSNITDVRTQVDLILKEDANIQAGYWGRILQYTDHPTPVNASMQERLREMLAERQEVCEYNETWQEAESIYLTGHESTGSRPLIQFYAYLFFQDWRHDLQMKRFARDNLRFSDIIQCAAARIVHAIREIARQAANGKNNQGNFDTMHVRRSDFKNIDGYKDGTDPAEKILSDKYFEDRRTVYIATDEQDKTFFNALHVQYNVLFLNNFDHLLKGVDPNYFGMIEQLVCARGDKFVGTYYSTFTAYINRIRGYHAQKSRSPDAMKGVLNSEYFGHGGNYRNVFKNYMSAHRDFWIREWPIAWRDIDLDVE